MPAKLEWPDASNDTLLALRAQGASWNVIAATLQVARNCAIEQARRLGLQPKTQIQPLPKPPVEHHDRPALPPGHPASWQAIIAGTSLADTPYPYPVFL